MLVNFYWLFQLLAGICRSSDLKFSLPLGPMLTKTKKNPFQTSPCSSFLHNKSSFRPRGCNLGYHKYITSFLATCTHTPHPPPISEIEQFILIEQLITYDLIRRNKLNAIKPLP